MPRKKQVKFGVGATSTVEEQSVPVSTGPVKYSYNCLGTIYHVWLEKATYANGRIALMLMDDEGQVACATVNIPGHDLGPNEILVKTWSENEGMLGFLLANRIVADLGRDVPTGYVKARVCKLLV